MDLSFYQILRSLVIPFNILTSFVVLGGCVGVYALFLEENSGHTVAGPVLQAVAGAERGRESASGLQSSLMQTPSIVLAVKLRKERAGSG